MIGVYCEQQRVNVALSGRHEDAARKGMQSEWLSVQAILFGADFIIAFIFNLFILYFICTAPIKSAPGGSTAPRSGEDSICIIVLARTYNILQAVISEILVFTNKNVNEQYLL